MTVREMIRELALYPMDFQVGDAKGSPVMFIRFGERDSNTLRLVPKSQIDLAEWLDNFFDNAVDEGKSDYDAYFELETAGIVPDDLKDYNKTAYEWALKTKRELDEDK